MTPPDVDKLIKAARKSIFPEFWGALILAVKATSLPPLDLLRPEGPARVAGCFSSDVGRLAEVDCPYDLEGSRWGLPAMLVGFRALATAAGIEGADQLELESLCSAGRREG
jgi:hypothetical protein